MNQTCCKLAQAVHAVSGDETTTSGLRGQRVNVIRRQS